MLVHDMGLIGREALHQQFCHIHTLVALMLLGMLWAAKNVFLEGKPCTNNFVRLPSCCLGCNGQQDMSSWKGSPAPTTLSPSHIGCHLIFTLCSWHVWIGHDTLGLQWKMLKVVGVLESDAGLGTCFTCLLVGLLGEVFMKVWHVSEREMSHDLMGVSW